MKKRLLIQTQLSNYDSSGKFILECDSGWNMVVGRVREMLKLNKELDVTIMCPRLRIDSQCITYPEKIHPDLWDTYGSNGENRLHLLEHNIISNALVTRYDFNWLSLANTLGLSDQKSGASPRWDAVYINDPMHLRNFKALFYVAAGYQPKFFVHSHFIDNPECPKFPSEASLWLGQCEAAIQADFNFWQCESSMFTFFDSMSKQFQNSVVNRIRRNSAPWDDGYSITEINTKIDHANIRFSKTEFFEKTKDKIIVFVPNRIGGRGRSSDYTNCGKFMFELLPSLYENNKDIVVVAGNPSQKFSNDELHDECAKYGYMKLTPDAFTRDEFKWIAKHSDVALGLYDQDTYGGTVARECIELGCLPLWLNVNEYAAIAREAGQYPYLVRPDWSDFNAVASNLFNKIRSDDDATHITFFQSLRAEVRKRCSYEATTFDAMRIMELF